MIIIKCPICNAEHGCVLKGDLTLYFCAECPSTSIIHRGVDCYVIKHAAKETNIICHTCRLQAIIQKIETGDLHGSSNL